MPVCFGCVVQDSGFCRSPMIQAISYRNPPIWQMGAAIRKGAGSGSRLSFSSNRRLSCLAADYLIPVSAASCRNRRSGRCFSGKSSYVFFCRISLFLPMVHDLSICDEKPFPAGTCCPASFRNMIGKEESMHSGKNWPAQAFHSHGKAVSFIPSGWIAHGATRMHPRYPSEFRCRIHPR